MDQREKERIEGERARRKAKIAKGASVIDPIVQIRFNNLEDPPAPGRPSPPFEFCFETPKGLILSFRISRTEETPDTALRHGEIYELPLSVVNHLNNVQMPVYAQKYVKDNIGGGVRIINYISGYRNRLTCTPVDMSNFRVIDTEDKKLEKAEKSEKQQDTRKSGREQTNKELAELSA